MVVVIRSLAMAQRDRNQDDLDEAARDSISRNTRELVEEMNDEYVEPQEISSGMSQSLNPPSGTEPMLAPASSVCPREPAPTETIGIMLVQLLERQGEAARCLPLGNWEEMIDELLEYKPDLVLVSALQPFALAHVRKLYSQIRARLPQTNILVGLWNFNGAIEDVAARFGPQAEGLIVTNLTSAMERLSVSSGERRVLQDHDEVASR